MTERRDGHTSIRVGGNVTGQFNVGNSNVQYWQQVRSTGPATSTELAELRATLADLRARVAVESTNTGAETKLDELEEALTGDTVDVPTLEHVQGWFRRKLPKFVSAVNAIIVSPIVAKLVAAGGDQLAAEFTRRFS